MISSPSISSTPAICPQWFSVADLAGAGMIATSLAGNRPHARRCTPAFSDHGGAYLVLSMPAQYFPRDSMFDRFPIGKRQPQ
jgi:hypothetical protein